jgi:iron complex transport system substrate-binding protein
MLPRRFLVTSLLALTALAAACGAGGATNQPTATITPAATASVAITATTAPLTTTVAAPRLPVTVTDKDGRRVTVSDVSRIVPLNGDITEVVFALGLGGNVVGVDTSASSARRASSASSRR